jgi:metal-responsive CopG/Arc/MetJ family transcriptional regulator
MSRISITLPNTLLDELLKVVPAKSKTEAVVKAITDEIKTKKKERIKAMAGEMEFTKEADELRHGDERLGQDTY